ncbi:MAG: GGDEF domain-containing protein [Blastocatellia bacterium]|nr:GGDEF domain-containing protein [Blastocatellia bacterium]
MRLTAELTHERTAPLAANSWESGQTPWLKIGWGVLVLAGLAAVAVIDRDTGSAPFQHLYYLPIILGGVVFGYRGGGLTSLGAMLLFHSVNNGLSQFHYTPGDMVQMFLFSAVGIVTAKLREDARRMHLLAHTDDVTGLHNLRSFEAHLNRLLRAATRNQTPITLMVLDLDNLKRLNDTYGHLVGCEAVRTVGFHLKKELPVEAVACRYGGDEFVIALPDCSPAKAVENAERIRQTVFACAPELAGHLFPSRTLTVSIGCVTVTPTLPGNLAEFGENLFRQADEALYQAKAQGKNQVFVNEANAPGSSAGFVPDLSRS